MDNINEVVFNDSEDIFKTIQIWQWSYGQILRITGLDLPEAVEIHFSLQEYGGEAEMRLGVTKDKITEVEIPEFILWKESKYDYSAYAFIYLSDEESGKTLHKIEIRVKARPKQKQEDENSAKAIIAAVNKLAALKVDKPTTAEVGQVLIVKAVDENGVPTEFEAADQKHIKSYNDLGDRPCYEILESEVEFYLKNTNLLYTGTPKQVEISDEVKALFYEGATIYIADRHICYECTVKSYTWGSGFTTFYVGNRNGDEPDKPFLVEYAKDTSPDYITVSESYGGYFDFAIPKSKFGIVPLDEKYIPKTIARTSEIPTKLPNPNKLIFAGAVTAEYDGSGAVTVTIPTGSGGSITERIEKASTDTAVTLEPNKLYVFPEMETLDITLAEITNTSVANEFHFIFQSGVTATTFSIPDTINIPSSFTVEASKIYEISIMENCLTYQSWEVA